MKRTAVVKSKVYHSNCCKSSFHGRKRTLFRYSGKWAKGKKADWKDTHLVKQSLPKEVFDAIKGEKRKLLRLLATWLFGDTSNHLLILKWQILWKEQMKSCRFNFKFSSGACRSVTALLFQSFPGKKRISTTIAWLIITSLLNTRRSFDWRIHKRI